MAMPPVGILAGWTRLTWLHSLTERALDPPGPGFAAGHDATLAFGRGDHHGPGGAVVGTEPLANSETALEWCQ